MRARKCMYTSTGVMHDRANRELSADMMAIPIGKAVMRNRQPMKLRSFAAAHNAFLFGLSLYMCLECLQQA